jgi:hypothetical protein
MFGCIIEGKYAFGGVTRVPASGSRNIFYVNGVSTDIDTLSNFQNIMPDWTGNAYAEPNFANKISLDIHLKSASGFVSNGVWVVDPAVGYSPAIDFGSVQASVGDEPDPTGGRVNIGL